MISRRRAQSVPTVGYGGGMGCSAAMQIRAAA
jgi:hypothetical protein